MATASSTSISLVTSHGQKLDSQHVQLITPPGGHGTLNSTTTLNFLITTSEIFQTLPMTTPPTTILIIYTDEDDCIMVIAIVEYYSCY